MRINTSILFASCLFLVLPACDLEREPGPHESEHGKILFWSITEDELVWGESCSDREQVRDSLSVPQLQEDSFLVYQLSEDGESATLMDCTSTDPGTCSVSAADVVFDVTGNTLAADRGLELVSIADVDCEIAQQQIWTLTDAGETLEFVRDLHLDLQGDECEDFEAWLRQESPNGQGFVGCVITLAAQAEFYSARQP